MFEKLKLHICFVPFLRPIVGELVAAKYSEDKAWYRAEVTAEDNDTFSLLFIDYGTRETSTEVNIRELNDLFLKGLPGLAICCSLEVSKIYWQKHVLD